MTAKTFRHSFHPWQDDPSPGGEVELSVEAIEAAGVREVLQTPGAALGSWSVLDVLLAKCNEFRFVEPLGQVREVKVALSGLFGRFVARAYLERYCGLHYFAHLGGEEIDLGGRLGVRVSRRTGRTGDLPDWVACAEDLTGFTVVEAKGSHARSGLGSVIARAREQAARVDVFVGQRRMAVKRIAVATRWGMLRDGPLESWIRVRDPEDEGGGIHNRRGRRGIAWRRPPPHGEPAHTVRASGTSHRDPRSGAGADRGATGCGSGPGAAAAGAGRRDGQ